MSRSDGKQPRKCPQGDAEIGQPCVKMSGSTLSLGLARRPGGKP